MEKSFHVSISCVDGQQHKLAVKAFKPSPPTRTRKLSLTFAISVECQFQYFKGELLMRHAYSHVDAPVRWPYAQRFLGSKMHSCMGDGKIVTQQISPETLLSGPPLRGPESF